MMAALPFIYTDVGIRSRGMIRPVTEVVKIASPVTAEIITLEASENSLVKENDIIATLDDADCETETASEQIQARTNRPLS